MSSSFNFRELVEEPFGPYSDDTILNPSFPPLGYLPTLTTLALQSNNQAIGFDDTETVLPPLKAQPDVLFFGILTIESLDWLSPQGHVVLQRDLRERDMSLHPRLQKSQLTLSSVYGHTKDTGSKLRAIIRCKKVLSAQYLTSDRNPDSFLIHSSTLNARKQTRAYKVESCDPTTFKKSRNYIDRYQLWSLINDIVDTDPAKTPLQDRTIDWLIDSYLTRIRPHSTQYSYILGSDSNNDKGEPIAQQHLRPISQAQVREKFAQHAEWLLAHQLGPTQRHLWRVNIKRWIAFCLHVQTARKEAARSNVRWGMPYGMNEVRGVPLASYLMQFGGTEEGWEKKLKNALEDKKPGTSQSQRDMSPGNEGDTATASADVEFQYDSDFSEDSTPPDSENDDEIENPEQVIELMSRVPWYCWKAPTIPAGHFIWNCPGCDYAINFLNLTPKDVEPLGPELGKYLRSKKWPSLREEMASHGFGLMVGNHYNWHMHERGVQLVKKGEKTFVEPWPAGTVVVKRETECV